MNNDFKTHYLYGFKDGLEYGIEKGIELAEEWNNCPPANSEMKVVETIPYTEPLPPE